MARELRAAGFDSGLAPVLDCLTDRESVAIGDRAYGKDPDTVAACGVAFVRAALAEGLVPVAKHFPGHGRTPLDSHLLLPEVDAARAELERTELTPFRQALDAGCPAVLVAHVRYPALDPDWPASLSARVVGGLLRGQLGFDGLVLSDDLEMAAVREQWGVDGAAVKFLQAGGDLALVCRDAAARDATILAVGETLDTGELSSEAAWPHDTGGASSARGPSGRGRDRTWASSAAQSTGSSWPRSSAAPDAIAESVGDRGRHPDPVGQVTTP